MKLGIVMDPIESIKPWKDSSFAMLLEAQDRGWQIYYMELGDLYMDNSVSYAQYHLLRLKDQNQDLIRLTDVISILGIVISRPWKGACPGKNISL